MLLAKQNEAFWMYWKARALASMCALAMALPAHADNEPFRASDLPSFAERVLRSGSAQLGALSQIYVQVYDVWAFQIGPILQSGLVPIVLAPIWVLYVYLQPFMDELWQGVSLHCTHFLSIAKGWSRSTAVGSCNLLRRKTKRYL